MMNSSASDKLPATSEFFDSHCHFDFSDFDSDRDTIWQQCQAQGVTKMLVPGVAPEQWQKAAQLSAKHQGIYCAAGIHPWWIKDLSAGDCDSIERRLREALAEPKCVAVGECGLDAMIETSLAEQLKVFNRHLQLASELQMPLIIHCRKAHNELLVALKKYSLPSGGVIHGFSGSIEMAENYWSLGFRLGIGGTITYERAYKTREAVKLLPIAAIVLETDAPDMPLQGGQGQRNSPQNIPLVARDLAEIRGESLAAIAYHTTQNACRLFAVAENKNDIA